MERDGPVVNQVFSEFGEISGMCLNVPKCVFIPLWLDSPERAAAVVSAWVPQWANFKVQYWGKYLGFVIGPEKSEHLWKAALAKYTDRARSWASLGLGLQFNAAIYNAYVLSVLTFLLQLAVLPPGFAAIEAAALRRLAPGPGNWIQPEDLYFLADSFGQARSFADPLVVSIAARVRVHACEAATSGGLQAPARAADLRAWLAANPPQHWDDWYAHAPALIVERGLGDFQRITRFPVRRLLQGMAVPRAGESSADAAARARKSCQRAAAQWLMQARRPIAEDRMRDRIERWRLPGPPLRVARRILRLYDRLRCLGPPRLGAAALSTAWNRWCTERRFGRQGPCVLGCQAVGAEDSIEHYSACSVVRRFAAHFLRLVFPGSRGVAVITLAAPEVGDDTALVRAAVLAYAVWRHTEATRRSGLQGYAASFHEQALQQAARQAVRGHSRAAKILDGGAPATRLGL